MKTRERITQCFAEGVSGELFTTRTLSIYQADIEVFDAYPRTRTMEFYAPNHAEAAQIMMRRVSGESGEYAVRKYSPRVN